MGKDDEPSESPSSYLRLVWGGLFFFFFFFRFYFSSGSYTD